MNTTLKSTERDETDAQESPQGNTPSSTIAKEVSDVTRERIAENAQLREELHTFMHRELKQPTTVIARPSGQYTYMTRFPTKLPPKFYALLGLEELHGDRYIYCYKNNGRVHLGLYPISSGQENIVYSFNQTEM